MSLHRVKANIHRTLRWIDDRRDPIVPARASRLLVDLPLVAEDASPLWNNVEDPREWPLEQGKVENLRVAARLLDGLELEARQTFSFWMQVGPPLRMRNFVLGRELREGCVVPGIGGGLCLLSNGLYAVARAAGFELLERHAHSRRPPGSRAAEGTDATVAWNYVDLRFRATQAWRLEVRLDAESLIVGVRTERRRQSMRVLHDRRHDEPEQPRLRASPSASWAGDAGRSCLSCDRDCDAATRPKLGKLASSRGRRSWLVDGAWPEFVRYLEASAHTDDRLLQPIDGELLRTPRYAWPRAGGSRPIQFPAQTLIRSLRARALAHQGPARQRALLEDQRRLATAMAETLEPRDTQLVIAQDLLAPLELLGVLGGRRVTVLMQRLPLFELQARLDEAHARHPGSPTLADFRADQRLLEAEARALDDAVEIVTPHPELAACYPGKTTRIDWVLPRVDRIVRSTRAPGPLRLWLPTSTVGRKGVHELREVLTDQRCELWIAGHELEGASFWASVRGLEIHHGSPALGSIDAVVLPAWIENQPRVLLRAIAAGVPVIASRACGVEGLPGVRTVAAGDVDGLRAALDQLVATPELDGAASAG
jgi:hypothetical protein